MAATTTMAADEVDPGIVFECQWCGRSNRVPYGRLHQRARCGACARPVHGPGHALHVDEGTLEPLIAHARVPVLVDFWASWCGPCRMMSPELEKVAEHAGSTLIVAKLDVDTAPQAAQRHRAQSVPLLALFQGGREVWRATGARPASRLEQELKTVLTRAA